MSALARFCAGACVAFGLGSAGCADNPGRPAAASEVSRPEQVTDFATLYKQNCAGCHGENGKAGAAISLANPVYLAFAGEVNLRNAIAKGVAGTLMPPFETSAGGALTSQQVDSLTQGMLHTWGRADAATLPYSSELKSDPAHGQKVFGDSCASCHKDQAGSITDPSYLALVSDQSLRSAIVAGVPEHRPMTGQDAVDVVAWIASLRSTGGRK